MPAGINQPTVVLKLILNYLDTIPPLLLLGFAWGRNGIAWSRNWIFWYVVAQATLNGLAIISGILETTNNLYIYHANCGLSFFLLSKYFGTVLHFRKIKRTLNFILIAFFLFFVVNLMKWESIQTFSSNSLGLASFVIVVYCFLYYLDKLIHPVTQNIAKSSDFWYVTGLFTYYASNFFIFITFRTLTQNGVQNLGLLWRVHNVVFLLMCIYILVGMICKPLPERFRL